MTSERCERNEMSTVDDKVFRLMRRGKFFFFRFKWIYEFKILDTNRILKSLVSLRNQLYYSHFRRIVEEGNWNRIQFQCFDLVRIINGAIESMRRLEWSGRASSQMINGLTIMCTCFFRWFHVSRLKLRLEKKENSSTCLKLPHRSEAIMMVSFFFWNILVFGSRSSTSSPWHNFRCNF